MDIRQEHWGYEALSQSKGEELLGQLSVTKSYSPASIQITPVRLALVTGL